MALLDPTKQDKAEVVKESINVAGLLTNVYSRSDLRKKDPSEPIVALFLLHQRLDSAGTMDPTARATFEWTAERQASSKRNSKDFVVVTFVRAVSSSFYSGAGDDVMVLIETTGRTGPAEPRHKIGGWSRKHGMES